MSENSWFLPTGVGIALGVVVNIIATLLQKKKISVDEAAGFQTALLTERGQLIAQIRELNEKQEELREENFQLRSQILDANAKIHALEHEKSRMFAEIETIKKRMGMVDDAK